MMMPHGQGVVGGIDEPPTRDIKELMDWLNAEKGAERVHQITISAMNADMYG